LSSPAIFIERAGRCKRAFLLTRWINLVNYWGVGL
jgi:hypothetical protein